jgi:serine phosphatase RsbU (regulator of sigma subunit)
MHTVLNRAYGGSFTVLEGYSRLARSRKHPPFIVPTDTNPQSPAHRAARTARARRWLTSTFAGRAVGLGALAKLTSSLAARVVGPSSGLELVDTLGDVAIVSGVVVVGYGLFRRARQRLLWRVRRKLILSYVFIGVVPVLLVVVFFALGGLLFFLNVSAFMLRSRVEALVGVARSLAEGAAPGVNSALSGAAAITSHQVATATRHPLVSYALVPTEGRCAGDGAAPAVSATAGPWAHGAVPPAIPDWVPCDGAAALIAYQEGGRTGVAARAVVWPAGLASALVIDIPFGQASALALHDEMGLTIEEMRAIDGIDVPTVPGASAAVADAGQALAPGGALRLSTRTRDAQEPLGWVAFVDYTDWETGTARTLTVGFRMGPAAVYRYLSGPSFEGLGNFSFGQVLLVLLAVVGGLFLVIQGVAFLMGLTLARSITGAVHELFVGTERVRQGDFSHKIAVSSRDQLGELASSFNSMTSSIEDLLHAKAEKERLEQELRVARSIQMSLLPQGPLQMPGLLLTGHCEPAREVGGDYYDFLPLEDGRVGILIADVAGKGTSAALYMAELKGLVLSLSLLHVSPRQLLIDANRIISKHLDARSFITMTYAVVDPPAGTLTFARAGHCPLVHVPGPGSVSRAARALVPDGMVLGLQLDTGGSFDRLLEEVTVPLGRGDVVLLYTDGISEAMNASGDCFGDARLLALAEQHADLPSDQLRERILRDVHAFTDGEAQHDDMTMVLLKIEDA